MGSRTQLDGLVADAPRADLADKLHLFGQFVGDWDVDWIGYTPGSAVGQPGKGEIHFAYILDGRAIQDVWIFPTRDDLRRGLPIDEWGSTVRFYDPDTDSWKLHWYGAVSHVVRTLTARPVGEDIWVEGANLQGQPIRWIFSQITDDSFHWSNFVSEDGGTTWRLQEELTARRAP
jgi:hypothetical protein